MKLELYSGERRVEVQVISLGDELRVSFGEKEFRVRVAQPSGGGLIDVDVDGKPHSVMLVEESAKFLKLKIDGESLTFGRAQVELGHSGGAGLPATQSTEADVLPSPLYGRVASIEVKAGDWVEPGQALLLVEAMKMESAVRADRKRKIKKVLVKEGEGIKKGQALIRFVQE